MLISMMRCDGSDTKKEYGMGERAGPVTMKGNLITPVGNEAKVGRKAPDVELVANDLSLVTAKRLSARPAARSSRTSACRRELYLQ